MRLAQFIGFAAGALTTIAFLPQVFYTIKTRSGAGLSYPMLIIFTAGLVLWLTYGLMIHSWPIIIANIVTLAFEIPLIFLKYLYDKERR